MEIEADKCEKIDASCQTRMKYGIVEIAFVSAKDFTIIAVQRSISISGNSNQKTVVRYDNWSSTVF